MARAIPIWLVILLSSLHAQELVFSVREVATATTPVFLRSEVWFMDGGVPRPLLPVETMQVLSGDRNGNGILDDEPANINAFHVAGAGGLAQWFFSTTATVNFPNGVSARNGDLVTFGADGNPSIAISQDVFTFITGTASVNLDAFCAGPGGEYYFSFADDVTTSDPVITAQNGGASLIDEQTVFRKDPGSAMAVIHFTQQQVVAFFNQAAGTNVSTVVDTTGITLDPWGGPGDLLLVNESNSAALKGLVASSRGGGTPFLIQGQATSAFFQGLGAAIGMNALSLTAGPMPPALRSVNAIGSSSAGGSGEIRVSGLAPGNLLRLIATAPALPAATAWTSPLVGGFESIYLDPSDPFFALSLTVPLWLLSGDANGEASFPFSFHGLPPGAAAIVQGLDYGTASATNPVHVTVVP